MRTQMTTTIKKVRLVKDTDGKITYHLPIGTNGAKLLKWKEQNRTEIEIFKAT